MNKMTHHGATWSSAGKLALALSIIGMAATPAWGFLDLFSSTPEGATVTPLGNPFTATPQQGGAPGGTPEPAPGSAPAPPAPAAETIPNQVRVSVGRVVDGDTFTTAEGKTVRVLGIDAPDLGHDGNSSEQFASQARSRTQTLLARAGVVTLSFDAAPTDHQGHALAYVNLGAAGDLGEILVGEGLAMAYFLPPNLSRATRYLTAERRARYQRLGIWSDQRLIPAQDAADHVGRARVVKGAVLQVKSTSDGVFLNFGAADDDYDFTAFIPSRVWKESFTHLDSPEPFQGKILEVRGRIVELDGPAITVNHPLQLKVVGRATTR